MPTETILAELLLRWEELTALGQEPVAEELCREYTELAPELGRRIGILKRWNAARESLVEPDLASEAATVPQTATGPALPRVPGYEILEKIGAGGMGVVYKARQVKLDRLVALKMIRAGGHAAATDLARFRTEAEAIAKVQHPGIVEVHDFGTHEGLPFFALEFCPGGNLAEYLSGTPLPGREAARIVEQLGRAMQAAHEAHVVHRDLKPANVLVGAGGAFKITDFGLAKRLDGASGLTQTDQVMGTPSYMAPEQALGKKEVGPAADVYALGAILYECLTGRPPFKAATPVETIRQVLDDEPVPPSRLQPKAPRDLETVCLKCLHKEPGQRYGSAGELADDLERFLADRPIQARHGTSAERAWRWCRRNPVVATLSAAVLLLLTVTALGGVVLSLSLSQALEQARQAEREGKRKLFASYVSEADAIRMSRRPGQRFGSLRRIRDALEVAREVGLSETDRLRLRNIALAALCLPDIEREPARSFVPGAPLPADLDPALRAFVAAHEILDRLPAPAYKLRGSSWFSADGRFVAAGTDPYVKTAAVPVRVWRIDDARPRLVVEAPQPVNEEAIAFRPDGGQAAFGHADGTVSLFDLETGAQAGSLGSGPGRVKCLAYHPSLPRLAVACGQEVILWDLDQRQARLRLRHPGIITAVAWHPRGHRLVTACWDTQIRLWDAATGLPVTAPWQGHWAGDIQLAFNHAGDRVVSKDSVHGLRLWDSATGQVLLNLLDEAQPVFSSDDRQLVQRWEKGKLEVWHFAGGQEMRTLWRPTPDGQDTFRTVALHPNGRLLVVKTERGIGFFDLRSGEEAGFVAGSFERFLDFDTAGATWTVGEAGLVRWPVQADAAFPWRWRVGPPEWIADVRRNGHDRFALSDDGRVVAVPLASAGTLVVHRGPPRRTLRLGPQHDVRDVFVSPEGRWVVTETHWLDSTGIKFKVWDANTGRLVANLSHTEVSRFHRFWSDSRFLYDNGNEVRYLDLASLAGSSPLAGSSGREDRVLPRQTVGRGEQILTKCRFSSDNRLVAVGGGSGSIRLVLREKDEEIARLSPPEGGAIWPCGFGPDGTLLLAQGEETRALYVFDLRRLHTQLTELGLSWDLPPFPPARPEESDRVLTPPLQIELIDAEAAAGRPQMAAYESRRAAAQLLLNPFDAESHYRLGVHLLEAGKLERAHGHLSAALACRPSLDEALYPRALAAFGLGRWADAADHASSCLERCVFDTDARLIRARAWAAQKRWQEAVADFTAVIAVYPSSASLYAERAHCYEALGQRDLGRTDRTQALKAGANHPAVRDDQTWRQIADPADQ